MINSYLMNGFCLPVLILTARHMNGMDARRLGAEYLVKRFGGPPLCRHSQYCMFGPCSQLTEHMHLIELLPACTYRLTGSIRLGVLASATRKELCPLVYTHSVAMRIPSANKPVHGLQCPVAARSKSGAPNNPVGSPTTGIPKHSSHGGWGKVYDL